MRRRADLLPLLILFSLLLLVLRQLAFTDWILGRGDTFVYFYPYWAVRDAFLQSGQLPLWTPNLFTGAPLLANPQLGTLYPPNWLTIGLSAPDAIRVSILLHVGWALVGAYIMARRMVGLSHWGALVTAALFGLGGTIGGHIEQINQLQGLAWLPWLMWLLHESLQAGQMTRYTLLLSMALALQVLSGHTQTVFISGVGMGVYLIAGGYWRGLVVLMAAGSLALFLTAPQLIPTLELIGQSGRSGGLDSNAALSFSLSPFIIGRGLLPSYDAKVFTEYIAYVGISGLLLATVGILSPNKQRRLWLIMTLVGLLLAVGAYNPLNWLIVQLPGFNLFRVPARWLTLYTLGIAVLAGLGLEALRTQNRIQWWWLIIGIGGIGVLAATTLFAECEQLYINGNTVPTLITWLGWGIALLLAGVLMRLPKPYRQWIIPLTLIELVAASWVMPYNDLVPPDVWHAQRLTMSHMLAVTQPDDNGLMDELPPPRLLSISSLFFDPGDKNALSARYQALGMSPLQERYSFVAAKLKETFSPNLPLAWDIATVDGFGGGLLPTAHYNTLMTLAYPQDITPNDGRLRENLAAEACRGACVPSDAMLTWLDVGYLITDKVYDVWLNGLSWDTNLTASTFHTSAPFMADTLTLLYQCADDTPDCIASEFHADDITLQAPIFAARQTFAPRPITSADVTDFNPTDGFQALGMTASDSRTNTFAFMTANDWARSLSSDVKLYTRTAPRQRAMIYGADDVTVVTDDSAALDALRDGATVTLHTDTPPTLDALTEYDVTFTHYSATRIELTTQSDGDGLLVLYDAVYPGWRASVNDNDMSVLRANVNFRAIPLSAGENHVIFEYRPWWLPTVLILGGLAWLITATTFLIINWRKSA